MKKFLIMGLVVFSSLLLSGCAKKEIGTSTPKSVEKVEQKVEQVSSGIVAPDNLQSCPEKYFAKKAGGGMEINCETEPKGEFCSYYKTEKDGVEKTHNLQFTTECILCRTHKQKGEVFLDGTSGKYTHLGYEVGPCTQGMYKK